MRVLYAARGRLGSLTTQPRRPRNPYQGARPEGPGMETIQGGCNVPSRRVSHAFGTRNWPGIGVICGQNVRFIGFASALGA